MHKRLRAGWLAAFLIAVVAALVAATTIGAGGNAVQQVGFASPEQPRDFGWNQQGFLSAQKAARANGATLERATGIGYENVEPALRRLAQRGADLIIAQASGYNTIAPKVAQQFRVPVLVYDNPRLRRRGLVANIDTTSQQGAYLAGVLAAQVTQTGTLGIVISAADTNWYKQSGGFIAGARSVNPDLQFRFAQIGQAAYADSAGGKRVTEGVLAAGADVVFGMGDGSSFGMLNAVEESAAQGNSVWFIDVIGNKARIAKNNVYLSSVLWDFTQIFNAAIRDVNNGRYGTHNYFLTVRNGISLLRTNKAPAAAWARVATARAGILDRSIRIPLTPNKAAVDRLLGS
jgi:simple sugar transport system substrate-binding protein